MNQDEIQAFAEAAREELNDQNKLSRCVDGRYENMENMPLIAKPGADAGDVLATLGALNILNIDLPTDEVVELIVSVLGVEINFRFHTDTNAGQSQAGIGCGHLKQAKLDPVAYGVTQEQIDFLFEQLPALLQSGAEQVVLEGDHAEQAVVVVESENFGLRPLLRSDDKIQEVFVYHKTMHGKQLEDIANALQEKITAKGQVVEVQNISKALEEAFGKQLTETLKRLASGLPVYTVTIDAAGAVSVI